MQTRESINWHEWRGKNLNWILGQKLNGADPAQFYFSNHAGASVLYSSCYAAFGLELYDNLAVINPIEQSNWCNHLLSHQDAASGFFVDPLMRPSDFPKTGHNWDYVSWQLTFFCISALDAFDKEPDHALTFLDDFLASHQLVDWLEQLDWSDPWLISNQIMFLLSFLLMDENSTKKQEAATEIFDWLDRNQNPATGFWDLGRSVPLLGAMAGAFHLYFLYFYAGRRINHPEQIIDHTLKLQERDGLFNPHGGGGSCHDLDAIDILVKFSLFCPHSATRVKTALSHAFDALLANRNVEGAFCEARRNLPMKSWKRRIAERLTIDKLLNRPWSLDTIRHAGWKGMEYRIDEGDLWSSWFRPLALALISSRYPGEFITGINWRFRSSPSLGWHNAEQIQKSQR